MPELDDPTPTPSTPPTPPAAPAPPEAPAPPQPRDWRGKVDELFPKNADGTRRPRSAEPVPSGAARPAPSGQPAAKPGANVPAEAPAIAEPATVESLTKELEATREALASVNSEADFLAVQVRDARNALKVKDQEIEQMGELIKTANSDAQAVKRRAAETVADAQKYAIEKPAAGILDTLDNFEVAISHASAEDREGLEMIREQLLVALEAAGITRMDVVGQPFDPTRHKAVSSVVSAAVTKKTVEAEVRPGYMLHERVIRPAGVVVAQPG